MLVADIAQATLDRRVFVERPADYPFQLEAAIVSNCDADIAFEGVRWRLADEIDRSPSCVSAVKGTLRPPYNLHPIKIVENRVEREWTRQIDSINVNRDARLAAQVVL